MEISQEKQQQYVYKLPEKRDQLCFFSPKLWGHEEWVVNNEKYCGKKLVFKRGFRCSLHYHKIKEETFYVLSGTVLIEVSNAHGDIMQRVASAGDVQHVVPYALHRISALTDAEVMEFSTHHIEADSYRVEESCAFDCSGI